MDAAPECQNRVSFQSMSFIPSEWGFSGSLSQQAEIMFPIVSIQLVSQRVGEMCHESFTTL
jgi:hypothetical protein